MRRNRTGKLTRKSYRLLQAAYLADDMNHKCYHQFPSIFWQDNRWSSQNQNKRRQLECTKELPEDRRRQYPEQCGTCRSSNNILQLQLSHSIWNTTRMKPDEISIGESFALMHKLNSNFLFSPGCSCVKEIFEGFPISTVDVCTNWQKLSRRNQKVYVQMAGVKIMYTRTIKNKMYEWNFTVSLISSKPRRYVPLYHAVHKLWEWRSPGGGIPVTHKPYF